MIAETQTAKARWELENNVQEASISTADSYYAFDGAAHTAMLQKKAWQEDPHYFKGVRVSALALLKMAMHAKSGGKLEVMGMLQGSIQGDTFVVIDVFALPVEGTETRVNAGAEAMEYMIDFQETNKVVGRLEHSIGWYHSHPGYGCWLSGIDVGTQATHQKYQDPFLAIVIDPHRTVSAGKVEIGAFRTYPEGYKPPDEPPSEYQTIPLSKIEDFGVHSASYYALDVSYFKSSLDERLLDALWARYWVSTLATSPLLAMQDLTVGQVHDIAEKLLAAAQAGKTGRQAGATVRDKAGASVALSKVGRDAARVATEQAKGATAQVIKSLLFNHHLRCCKKEPARQAHGQPEAVTSVPMES